MSSDNAGENPICPICVEAIEGESCHELSGCRHAFHPNCIIEWMRRGNLTCPTCRSSLSDTSSYTMPLDVWDRASYMRSIANRPTSPPELKRLLSKLRDAESKLRAASSAMRDFKRSHSEYLRTERKLSVRISSSRRRVYNARTRLGMFHSNSTPLPPLAVIRM